MAAAAVVTATVATTARITPSYGVYPYVYRSSYYPPVYYGPTFYGGYGRHRHDGGLYISLGF